MYRCRKKFKTLTISLKIDKIKHLRFPWKTNKKRTSYNFFRNLLLGAIEDSLILFIVHILTYFLNVFSFSHTIILSESTSFRNKNKQLDELWRFDSPNRLHLQPVQFIYIARSIHLFVVFQRNVSNVVSFYEVNHSKMHLL